MGRTRRAPQAFAHANPRDADLPFDLSAHAIARFQERMTSGMSYGRCAHELRRIALTCRRTQDRTKAGQELWVATEGEPLRFVVKPGTGRRVCVTVLEPKRAGEDLAELDSEEEVA